MFSCFSLVIASVLRDYSQDLDAILVARPAKFTAEMTAMWQDHVGRALIHPGGKTAGAEETSTAVDEAEEIGGLITECFQR